MQTDWVFKCLVQQIRLVFLSMQYAGSVKTNLGFFLWSWLSSGPFLPEMTRESQTFCSWGGRRTEFPKYSTTFIIFTVSKVKVCCSVILLGILSLIHKRVRETEWRLKGYRRDVYRIYALNRLSIFIHFCFTTSHAVMFSLMLSLFLF